MNDVRLPFTVTPHLLPYAWEARRSRGSVACLSEDREFRLQLLQLSLDNLNVSRHDLKVAVFDRLVQFYERIDRLFGVLPYSVPLLMVTVEIVADAGLGQFVSAVSHDHLQ